MPTWDDIQNSVLHVFDGVMDYKKSMQDHDEPVYGPPQAPATWSNPNSSISKMPSWLPWVLGAAVIAYFLKGK